MEASENRKKIRDVSLREKYKTTIDNSSGRYRAGLWDVCICERFGFSLL